jgi:REP-associated tyrosine transposase
MAGRIITLRSWALAQHLIPNGEEMSYVRIWLHCVWGTKNRFPFIDKNNKKGILSHIRANAKDKSIYIDSINAVENHVHCVISLNKDQTISKVMNLIKGESSFWINKNKLTKTHFEWADEYFAVSVSESQLEKVRKYINNQEQHHMKKSWEEECGEFMEKYNFTRMLG